MQNIDHQQHMNTNNNTIKSTGWSSLLVNKKEIDIDEKLKSASSIPLIDFIGTKVLLQDSNWFKS